MQYLRTRIIHTINHEVKVSDLNSETISMIPIKWRGIEAEFNFSQLASLSGGKFKPSKRKLEVLTRSINERSATMERANRRAARTRGASQAEILRSRQRDDVFVKNLRDNLSDVLIKLGSNKLLLHIMQSEVPSKLAYFIFTTGMNNQTIGEEYTGIIQADTEARRVPSLGARIFAVLLECFGEEASIKILNRLLTLINHPHTELKPEAVSLMNSVLTRLRTIIPVIIQAHRGLFYIFGHYYSLGKRLTGINYVKVYGRRPAEGINWALRLLGAATLAQCVLKFWSIKQQQQLLSDKNKIAVDTEGGGRCQLCLDVLPTTATPCGHLFCWQCISDWLSARPQCPFCREYAHPSRIIFLLNI